MATALIASFMFITEIPQESGMEDVRDPRRHEKKAPKCPCPLRLLPDSSGFVTAFKTILPTSYLTSLFADMLAAL